MWLTDRLAEIPIESGGAMVGWAARVEPRKDPNVWIDGLPAGLSILSHHRKYTPTRVPSISVTVTSIS